MPYRYEATAYRQATNPESPWLIAFVATAEDLLKWAGIPRRAEAGLIGFQRTDDAGRVGRDEADPHEWHSCDAWADEACHWFRHRDAWSSST